MSDIGGEAFLQVNLPNYGLERFFVTFLLLGALIVWLVLVPLWWSTVVEETVERQIPDEKTGKRKKKTQSSKRTVQEKVVHRETSVLTNLLATCGCLVTIVYLLLTFSPNNYYIPHRVFEAPLLTAAECDRILEMAHAAAQRNYENALASTDTNEKQQALLQEPVGWHKTRHGNYPTTDLNVVTDKFTDQDMQYFGDLLDRRLAPTLSRIYGIPVSCIRANDMFVVRYDADKRAHLSNHTDDGDISINILLNDEFEGGGTRFWNRLEGGAFGHVQPPKGHFVTHPAQLNHEGYQVTNGTRFIFVGFLSVDRIDPWTKEPTGMSWYASWFSLSWMHVKFKDGYHLSASRLMNDQILHWNDNKYVRAWFAYFINLLEFIGDFFATHRVEHLVDDQNAGAYLQALDEQYEKTAHPKKASWFRGQQINLDFDGSIDSEWSTRRENVNRFMEL